MFLREALPTGEPTVQPSKEPSGQPTWVPTGEPTGKPTTEPTGRPSSQPTCQPSDTPTGQPTDEPTSIPTGEPTTQPSGVPTSQPTIQPSSHPTLLTLENDDNVFLQGGDDDNPINFALTNLGFSNRTGAMYLSVDIYTTNFEVIGEQWATVRLNGRVINPTCTPDVSCEDKWYTCVSWLEVSQNLSSHEGGSLHVQVSSQGVSSGPCDYLGYPLYAQVFLTELPPPSHSSSLSIWAIIGPVIFGIFAFIAALWYFYTRHKRKNDKYGTDATPSDQELVSGDQDQNEDALPDPEANQHQHEKLDWHEYDGGDASSGLRDKSSPRRSPRFGGPAGAKVVPLENDSSDLQLQDHDEDEEEDMVAPPVVSGDIESAGVTEEVPKKKVR